MKELKELAKAGGLQLKDFINTRSQAFKKIQPDLPNLDEKGIADLIKQEPRIMVRPIIWGSKGLITGFKEAEYNQLLDSLDQ